MNAVIIILNFVVIMISLVMLLVSPYYDATMLNIVLGIALIPLITFFIINTKTNCLRKQYFRISYMFLIGFLIVFFQNNIDIVLGNIDIHNTAIFSSPNVICKCAILSLIGFSSFVIGIAMGVSKYKKYSEIENTNYIPKKFITLLKVLFLIFVVIYLSYNSYNILSGNFFYNQETLEEASGTLSNYSIVMIQVLTFTILSCISFNIRIEDSQISPWIFIKTTGLIFNFSLIVYLIFVFMTGDRGPIMISLLAYSISYIVASKRNISWVAILLCIVLGGYCLTLIGSVRRNANLITLKEIMSNNNTVETKSILPFTEELAGSYNTFTYVVDNIPQKHPYFYGTMQLRNIGYSVPFLHHILPFIYSKIDYENSTTSYCTYLIQGINSTYGNGASLLADIYLDFGVIGIIIIMMLIGYFVSLLDYSLFFGKSIYSLLISVICFSYSIYISRSILVTPIYYILPSIMIIYFKNFLKK